MFLHEKQLRELLISVIVVQLFHFQSKQQGNSYLESKPKQTQTKQIKTYQKKKKKKDICIHIHKQIWNGQRDFPDEKKTWRTYFMFGNLIFPNFSSI
jgi:hypothetical protein